MNHANFITIQGWMRTELNLKGNDLLVYAIIYGFCQNREEEDSVFSGSLQYLANWCGATKQGISHNLEHLINRNLIIKKIVYKNNIRYCIYSTNFNTIKQYIQLSLMDNSTKFNRYIQQSQETIKQSCTNNIIDNIDIDNIDKNIYIYEKNDSTQLFSTKQEISKSKKDKELKDKKAKKISYEESIVNYTDNMLLQDKLREYLVVRKKKYPLNLEKWKKILTELDNLATKDNEKIKIVQQSIDKNYGSVFAYNYNSGNTQNVFGEQDKPTNQEMCDWESVFNDPGTMTF